MINFETLRPNKLNKFIGKNDVIESIRIGIEVAKKTNSSLDHTLFYGPPGVGKTSLAQIIANEMNVKIKIIQSSNINNLPDLIGVLSSLKNFDILFIDEIHSLKKDIAEILYPALEDNALDIVIGKNYNSKVIRLKMPQFTLIAATTNLGALAKALEERFGYIFFIDVYSKEELFAIVKQNLKNFDIQLTDEEIEIIIDNSRGIPRNCNRIIKRICNYKIIEQNKPIQKIIRECGYIFNGITEIDLKYLMFLKQEVNYTSGIKSIMQGINLDEKTLIHKIEPFLINRQYITKLPKGRALTKKGVRILHKINQLNE